MDSLILDLHNPAGSATGREHITFTNGWSEMDDNSRERRDEITSSGVEDPRSLTGAAR